jgi:phage tail sheath protein FI
MAVNLVSPGVKIREVDLTIGRIDQSNDQIGAFAGPFAKGPVNLPVLIQNEQQLLNIFGKPKTDNKQNTYWLHASNYLSYGGIIQVVRVDSSTQGAMKNAYYPASVGIGSTANVKIKSVEDYNNKSGDSFDTTLTQFYYAAKNPGTWANNLTVYAIDGAADQTISGISTVSLSVGYGVSITATSRLYAGLGVTSTFNGYFKGIITGIGQSSVDVKLISRHSNSADAEFIDYSNNNPLYSIQNGDVIRFINPSTSVAISTITNGYTLSDWYNNQTVDLGNSTVYWKNIAERPSTSEYAKSSGGKNDEYNLIVVDTQGKINGNVGEILEKYSKLSKAVDGKITPSQSTYYTDYIRDNSTYVFVGVSPNGVSSRFASIDGYTQYSEGYWENSALNRYFNVVGNQKYVLNYGTDYSTSPNDYGVSLGDITNAYSLFENPTAYAVNFIVSGPSGGTSIFEAQAKANYIISLAESRKDCIAVISPYEDGVVNVSNSTTQTNNVIQFFNGVTSSNYAVFDSGYKYTYDRFNNKFLYLACNSDIAGLMARTSINQYPWYSPAGAARGVLNNAIKLAYNPSEAQRDLLYNNKINPVIASPGQGIILYGDKTASAYVSAFDRINVRRLFLTLEKTIERAARSQLFEFNDSITRTNFVNIVEPYLRDVRAKRGITEFLLICDESNNTPDIIDSNQFRADIYIKPSRSINFVGLTFVATRTGISFSEIVGTV